MSNTFTRLASGSILRTISLVVTIVISFFMMPFLIKALGSEKYGIWVLVGSLMGYYMVVDFGLLSATQRFLAKNLKDSNQLNQVINTSFVMLSSLTLLVILLITVFWLLCPLIIDKPEHVEVMQKLVVIMGTKTVITLPLMVFNGMLSAKLRFDIASYIEITKNILRTVFIVLYVTKGLGLITIAYITLFSELLAFLAITIAAYRIYPEANYGVKYISRPLAKDMLNFGKYSFVIETSEMLKTKLDDFIVAKVIGLSSVTTFAIAFSLFNYAIQFIGNLFGGLVTVFSKDHDNNNALKGNYLLLVEVAIVVTTFMSVFILIFGLPFIISWVGEEYKASYDVLFVLVLCILFGGASRANIPLFYATAKHKKLAFWNITEGCLNLLLSLSLAKSFGLIGVALGTLISTAPFKLLQIHLACKIIDYPMTSILLMIGRHWLFAGVFYLLCTEILQLSQLEGYIAIFSYGFLLSCIYILIVCRYVISKYLKDNFISHSRERVPTKILRILFGNKKECC